MVVSGIGPILEALMDFSVLLMLIVGAWAIDVLRRL